jgi:hypothetical protein
MITDKVRSHHLERKALLYVRQSSPHQVLHNRESGALQYAMQDRLTALALWARQSRWHSLQLLLAASAPPPKTAILKPAITQKRTIDDSCSFMAEPLLSGLPLFHLR